MNLYENNINKVKESFKNITGKISFTINVWTSPSVKSFLSLTAHYIDNDWKLRNILVDFIQIFGNFFFFITFFALTFNLNSFNLINLR
jgi:hypothetical protein